ncbi:MAG: phage portal protein [Polyangiales bacterium]
MSILERLTDRLVTFGQDVATRILAPAVSTRARELEEYERLYQGRQYENRGLSDPWDKAPPGRRVPLRSQRPSVQYDLPRPIVDRPTALLFGEGRFPELLFEPSRPPPPEGEGEGADSAHEAAEAKVAEVNAWLAAVVDEGGLPQVALTWARQGARLSSACLTWSVVDGEFEFEAHATRHCTPTFHPRRRGELVRLEKRYKHRVATEEVRDGARVVVEVDYWHREVWDERSHVVFHDERVTEREPTWRELDRAEHDLGFVPGVWVKNLDDGEPGRVDGLSLLDGIADVVEDIDRTLSQKSRAVRYNQEPERVYFGLREEDKNRVEAAGGGSSRALPPKKDGGDATLLELKGDGQRVAEEHVVAQRGRALEVTRVTMPDPERLLAASRSGAALRILFAPTLELVGELRQTYGRGLRRVFGQILRAARGGLLARLGALRTPPPASIPEGKIALLWGDYFDPTPQDLLQIAQTMQALRAAGAVDRETMVRWLASYLGVRDVRAVLARLEAEEAAAAAAAKPAPADPKTPAPGQRPAAPTTPTTPTEEDDDDG